MSTSSDQPIDEYSQQYSEGKFFDKLLTYAKVAGTEVVERALHLYFALQDPNTPKWAKITIIGALGYFITPLDAIPDFIPVVGYSDDLGVLALALARVAMCITPEIKAKARAKMTDWFGGESSTT
jgi:uncharacterized membrane protein YkvA (DUF1232 family)